MTRTGTAHTTMHATPDISRQGPFGADESWAPSGHPPRKTLAATVLASGLVLAAVALAVLLFAFAVGRGYDHDEEQYVAAGVLAMSSQVYRDFIYLQTPL